jgi:subtilisin family serine protease
MRGLLVCVVFTAVLGAETVPGRYIVELVTEPVAEHLARLPGHPGMRSAEAAAHRAMVRAGQEQVRRQLGAGAVVLDSTDTVANALLVDMADAKAAQVASLAGVRRVYPVRTFKLLLDRAVVVNKVAEAWNQVGAGRAGAGVKIAIIDTGIDASHAGFQDSGLVFPASFPKTGAASDQAYTNGKVIVARSYVSLLPYRDPDTSARDHVGHGTAVAMTVAGARNTGPLATIQGAAPGAYLGNYKVYGTPGYNNLSNDAAILKALDDAVADGMDIINLSTGNPMAPRLADDIEVQAVERATAAGVLVVVSAGNDGPDPNTIESPASAPSAIAVGASHNERTFATMAQVAGMAPVMAVPGDGPRPAAPMTAPLADVAAIDGDGRACAPLPPNSLAGAIALILRGNCFFESKLDTVQAAGAVAALIYAAPDAPDAIPMGVGAATLPAEMISNPDGMAFRQSLAAQPGLTATMHFDLTPFPTDAGRMANFSSTGPNVDAGIKPDLVTVGSDVYMATQSLDSAGEMYDPSGYILENGTSFAAPLVAGCAAIIKGARPGLTVAQYRSLIINTAVDIAAWTGAPATVGQAGAGALDCGAALAGTIAASPTSLGFGAGGGALDASSTLTVTNLGTASDTFSITPAPSGDDAPPVPSANTLELAPGASGSVTLSWSASALAPGAHEGQIRVRGAVSGAQIRIPYWYGVVSGVPARVTVLDVITSGRRTSSQPNAIRFRVTDSAGMPVTGIQPQVSAVSGDGAVLAVLSQDRSVPGLFSINLRLGATAGTETYRIQAGDASVDVSITVQ